jgi:hypothetical protein
MRLAAHACVCLRHTVMLVSNTRKYTPSAGKVWKMYLYSRTPVSADSVSAVSVIHSLPRPENINTFTAKVDHG